MISASIASDLYCTTFNVAPAGEQSVVNINLSILVLFHFVVLKYLF